MESRVAISIVSYNTSAFLSRCLESIALLTKSMGADDPKVETWVVDNASRDGSAEMVRREFPWVKLIALEENLGFGAANNCVFERAESDYVLVLNPDTEIDAECLRGCWEFAEANRDVGILGCRVELPDGSLDRACKRGIPTPLNALCYFVGFDRIFPRNRIIGGYNATFVDEDEVADVGAVVGAFMFVRHSVFDKIGYFDEQFFMYGEDIDLCYRCTQVGARVVYLPRYKIRHHKGVASGIKKHSAKQSTATLAVRVRMVREFHDSMLIFYNKHQRGCHGWPVNLLVRLGVYTRRWVAVRRVQRGKGLQ